MDTVLTYRKKYSLMTDQAFEKHIRKRLALHWFYVLIGVLAGTFILIWLRDFYLLAAYFYGVAILSIQMKKRVKEDRLAFQMNQLNTQRGVLHRLENGDKIFVHIQDEGGRKIHVHEAIAEGLHGGAQVILFSTPKGELPVRFLTEEASMKEEYHEKTKNEA